MKRFLYLFFAIIIFYSFVVAASYSFDDEIYVNPFVFGVIKGDDGIPLNLIDSSNFSNGKFQTFNNSVFTDIYDLNVSVLNNNLVIFKILVPSKIKQNNNLHKFFIKFQTIEYSDENINVLFKLS